MAKVTTKDYTNGKTPTIPKRKGSTSASTNESVTSNTNINTNSTPTNNVSNSSSGRKNTGSNSFDASKYVESIVNFKSDYDKAKAIGDTAGMEKAQKGAAADYLTLRDAGHGDIADKLSGSSYQQAKDYATSLVGGAKTVSNTTPSTPAYANKPAVSTPTVPTTPTTTNSFDFMATVNGILGDKEAYDKAKAVGDTVGMANAQNSAKARYEALNANGYEGVAKNLSNYGLEDAKWYVNHLANKNTPVQTNQEEQTTVREELNELAREKNTGLDYNSDLNQRYIDTYNYLMKINPFSTEEAKAILGQYGLKALQGRDNAIANGAADNGGNIDSFAAANALRQQAALTAQGQQVVLDSHQQKVNNAISILEKMGVNISRQVADGETIKNGEVARETQRVANDVTIAEASGYAPSAWVIKNDAVLNKYLNEDGTPKDICRSEDFTTLINNALANGNTVLAEKYRVIRGAKIDRWPEDYNKYRDGNVSYLNPQQTQSSKEFDKTLENDRHKTDTSAQLERDAIDAEVGMNKYKTDAELQMNSDTNATNMAIAESENRNNLEVAQLKQTSSSAKSSGSGGGSSSGDTLSATKAENAIKNGIITEKTIRDYNTHFGTDYTVDNPPPIVDLVDDGNDKPPMTAKEVEGWVTYLNEDIQEKYGSDYSAIIPDGYNLYKRGDVESGYIISAVMSSSDLTEEQKEFLLFDKFQISIDEFKNYAYDKHYR